MDFTTELLCELVVPQTKGLTKLSGKFAIEQNKHKEFLFALLEQYYTIKDSKESLLRYLPLNYWEYINKWGNQYQLHEQVNSCYK